MHPAPSVVIGKTIPTTNATWLNSDGVATDLAGNQTWFNPNALNNITRAEAGGYFWRYVQDPGADPAYQLLRKVDLPSYIPANGSRRGVAAVGAG